MHISRYWPAAAVFFGGGLSRATAQVADDPDLQATLPLTEIIATGGWLMYVLGAMSVVGLACVLYFVIVLRRRNVAPREFLRDLHGKITAGRFEEALEACRRDKSAIASIAESGLEYVRRSGRPDPSLLREIMEGEGSRRANEIQDQTRYLLDIAAIAPMVGLLGTVLGMLRAFNAVALDIAKAKPMILAAGVSQALVTTAAGLMVGIPAMIFYAYFRGRSSKLIALLETHTADLLTLIVQHCDTGNAVDRSSEPAGVAGQDA